MKFNKIGFLALCAGVLFALSFSPSATAAPITTAHMEVLVSAGGDSGSWSADVPLDIDPDIDFRTWFLTAPVSIHSSTNPSTVLATIDGLSLAMLGDPSVTLNFAVIAGAANTNFTINSAVLGFPGINNALGSATAAITATSGPIGPLGATLTGLYPGSKAYQARYNGANVFANLVSPVTAPPVPTSSATGSEAFPVAGMALIPGVTSSIESSFRFTLSARDSASGTSQFEVVPEPSTMVLALVGAAGLLWRVRRRK